MWLCVISFSPQLYLYLSFVRKCLVILLKVLKIQKWWVLLRWEKQVEWSFAWKLCICSWDPSDLTYGLIVLCWKTALSKMYAFLTTQSSQLSVLMIYMKLFIGSREKRNIYNSNLSVNYFRDIFFLPNQADWDSGFTCACPICFVSLSPVQCMLDGEDLHLTGMHCPKSRIMRMELERKKKS